MLGKFQLETSEGLSDFMYKMGVGWFQRSVSDALYSHELFYYNSPFQIACTLYPVTKISQTEDGDIIQVTQSTFKTKTDIFRLNTPYQVRHGL